ncbi:MAG: hypothetical protein J7K54_02590 [Candidatus Aenigmarchaeota archaeon]|nr:hypothetical protein [Candidatus Aenigmarchaeota archaeon]
MEASRLAVVVAFAIIISLFFFIIATRVVGPLSEDNPFSLGDTVALYIDTLSSLEAGSVRIPVALDSVESLSISYEEKGKKDGYEIERAGWYVINEYKISGKTSKSPSRINTLPASGGFEKTITKPQSICITKRPEMPYAEVDAC